MSDLNLSLVGVVPAAAFHREAKTIGRAIGVMPMAVVWLSLGLFCGLIVFVSENAQAQGDVPAWKFKTADAFTVAVTKQVQRTAKLNSKVTVVESEVGLLFDWKVVEVSDEGTAKIEQELTRYSIRVGDPAVPRQAISFASDDPPSALAVPIRKLQRRTKPLIGLKSTFSMSASGAISDVVLADESKSKLKKLEDSPQVQSLLDEDALREAMSAFNLNVMPNEVNAGKWSRSEVKNDGAEIQHDFRLGDPVQIKDRSIVAIEVKSKMAESNGSKLADKKLEAKKNQILQTFVSLAGSGQVDFDVEAGYFPNSKYLSTAVSERKYREKTILTTVESSTQMKIEKQ
jgi:hypothetical protein